jgi:hypothetical protein
MCDSFVGKYERVHEENYEEYLKVSSNLSLCFVLFWPRLILGKDWSFTRKVFSVFVLFSQRGIF